MKIVMFALVAAGLLLAQDKPAQAKKAEPQAGAAKGAAGNSTLPSGAKEVEPGLYRYTDAQGKTWMYRNTPFGLAKWEDKPATAAPLVQPAVPVSATDLGDSVRFERQTPFGQQKWTKKKTDLTEDEKAYLKKQSATKPDQEKPQPPDKNLEKPSA
ncbi:MAG TPA: hypothetical protein VIX89_20820 [Bryobacteraceae bacterium]